MREVIRLPKLDQDMTEGTVLEWLVEVGQEVVAEQPLVVIETDKVSTEITASAPGVVEAILVLAGDSAPVGGELALVSSGGTAAAERPPEAIRDDQTPTLVTSSAAETVAPTTARTSREVAPNDEHENQRLPRDRSEWSRPHAKSPRQRSLAGQTSDPREQPAASGSDASVRRRRQAPLVATVEASWGIPQFAATSTVHATQILDVVRAFEPYSPPRVTVTHVLLKMMAAACVAVPVINAHYIDDQPQTRDTVDINLLVEVGDELLNPCLRDVPHHSIASLAGETRRVVEACRDHTIERRDLAVGSMTLSNLGMYLVDEFAPLLVPPQVTILGIGRISGDPPTFSATLVADHRAVNGAHSARWLTAFRRYCEDPRQLL